MLTPSLSRRASTVAFVGLLSLLPTAPARAVIVPTNFEDTVIASGLSEPTAMAFLPDGRVLVTEQRTGYVRLIVNGAIAAFDPVLIVPDLAINHLERGLQSIAIDPGWPRRPYVYLSYNRLGDAIRLVRYTAIGRLHDPDGQKLGLQDPFLILDDLRDQGGMHNGGCLRFGPDRHLYMSLGDDGLGCFAQEPALGAGQIIRLDVSHLPSGAGGPPDLELITPAGNPFPSANDFSALTWVYGLRNPFRFHMDPMSGAAFVADVGELSWEEYNELYAGQNAGWPWLEAFAPFGTCGSGGSGPYRDPIIVYNHSTGNTIVSAGIYWPVAGATHNWPAEYWGDAFFADYYGQFLRRIKRLGPAWAYAPPVPGMLSLEDWGKEFGSAVDFVQGPDGSLWWVQQYDVDFLPESGTLHRIRYEGGGGGTPDDANLLAVDSTPGAVPLSASPSPFATRTEFAFSLAQAAPVRLSVYDVAGREVRRLLDSDRPAGVNRVSWDGVDDDGRPVAPGLYLVRLDRPGGRDAARVMKVH